MTNLYLMGDFETTVYENQQNTEVWASAVVPLFSEDVKIFHSIDETFEYLCTIKNNVIIYYHNLKFDGTFWLYYLKYKIKYKEALFQEDGDPFPFHWMEDNEMPSGSFKYSISDRGQWYYIKIQLLDRYIEIRDSFKLLPVSVKRIGQSFGTKHQKLDMEYTGYRYAGCEITEEEQRYIANDVLVVKEALEILFNEGHKELTIGSCCMKEYKTIVSEDTAVSFEQLYPLMSEISLDESYGSDNAESYIRKSYKGGWCYCVKGKENRMFYNGITADVNSLYPSVMHSVSNNRYPVGKPTFWKGNYLPQNLVVNMDSRNGKLYYSNQYYFFIRIKCRFRLKKNMLPTVQIKSNVYYKSNEWLETSDIYYKGQYYKSFINKEGEQIDARPILTFTCTDYFLFLEHYNVSDFEILDGCYFHTEIGMFDKYINKYREIKMTSKGAKREIAKLFLNNLYGKLASSTNSSYKLLNNDPSKLMFLTIPEHKKKPLYIPIGSAITSYARFFTISAAQMNYYGVDKPGFIYADTDSIHCDLQPKDMKGIRIDNNEFCCWKLEGQWDKAIFVRQKTYMEHIIAENLEPVDQPYDSIKCAGMPTACKILLEMSLMKKDEAYWKEITGDSWDQFNETKKEFILTPRDYTDFRIGLCIEGKLIPKQIEGGTVLVETTYEMR